MANSVTYNIDLIPENADLINKLNKILITGETSSAEEPSTTSKPSTTEQVHDGDDLTMDDLKTAAKAAKKDHGEEFAMGVLKDAGVAMTTTLLGSMKKADTDDYADIIAAWEAGPQESDDGLGDDGDDGLGEDDAEVSAEAVKTALKAYAKETGRAEAKEVMTSNGAKALSDVDDCSPEQLAAMMKAMV